MNILLTNADALHIPLADRSVHCCVTSPPYWALRDYGVSGQLGLEPTPEEYVSNMVQVFREVKRVLRDDGVVFLNLGDSYFSTSGQTGRNDGGRPEKGRGWAEYDIKRTKISRASAQRAKPCDTSGKAPVDYQDHDCLCGSLCDACRRAYRIGKSHNDNQRVPMLSVLPSETSRERTEEQTDHLPTSDSMHQEDHSVPAILDSENTQDHEAEQLPASLVSRTGEFSQQFQDKSSRASIPTAAVCQLCGRSFVRSSLACECKKVSRSANHLKPKDLVGIPWRVAFALQADGWYLRSDIIWSKPNPMPESVTDRPTKAHEYIFLLSKSEKYYYDQDAIREPYKTTDDHRGSAKWVQGWASEGDHTAVAHNTPQSHHGSKFPSGKKAIAHDNIGIGPRKDHPGGRNRRTVWEIATEPTPFAHFATFPRALVEPCIKAGCPAGGIVLDPFAGSGTTGIVARQHGRRFVGLDLSLSYLTTIARNRLGMEALEAWTTGIKGEAGALHDLPLFSEGGR
jgi:DNA modification methylase